MLACTDFLSTPDCLETEGIFRRSANAALIKELQVCDNPSSDNSSNDNWLCATLYVIFKAAGAVLKAERKPLLTKLSLSKSVKSSVLYGNKKAKNKSQNSLFNNDS